jgi:hypothetical protein
MPECSAGSPNRRVGGRPVVKRFALTASLAALSLITTAWPAAASVSIGQLAPTPDISCAGTTFDIIQPDVASGTPYSVPAIPSVSALVISSWSHQAGPTSGPLTFKVFRPAGAPGVYAAVAHDGPRNLTPNIVNTFATNLPVQTGDLIGINSSVPAQTNCTFDGSGPIFPQGSMGNLADGASGTFGPLGSNGRRLNVSAVVAPNNTATVGKTTLNKKKGTATLNLTLPNPGELTGSGNGVKAASAGRAVISKSVGAGPTQLLIKAKGKKKRKLNDTGKVKLNVAITYTPTDGDPGTQSVKVKLKKL